MTIELKEKIDIFILNDDFYVRNIETAVTQTETLEKIASRVRLKYHL